MSIADMGIGYGTFNYTGYCFHACSALYLNDGSGPVLGLGQEQRSHPHHFHQAEWVFEMLLSKRMCLWSVASVDQPPVLDRPGPAARSVLRVSSCQ